SHSPAIAPSPDTVPPGTTQRMPDPQQSASPPQETTATDVSGAKAPEPPAPRRKNDGDAPETGPRKRRGKQAANRPADPSTSASGPPHQDVHAWLSGRISELTQERTSRWQRILQLLTNGGS
ncbi:MAG TPA: hypothetical protein VL475_06015, partial [Planctomycetaceae bacterium]|nr:hypothetical protein [Planctomycetaceae bacterium]